MKKDKTGGYGMVQINEHELEAVGNKGRGLSDLTAGIGSNRDDDALEELNDGYVCNICSQDDIPYAVCYVCALLLI